MGHINIEIADAIRGMEATRQSEIDRKMIEQDGSSNKGLLGANAILAVSLAVARAAAVLQQGQLFHMWGAFQPASCPCP